MILQSNHTEKRKVSYESGSGSDNEYTNSDDDWLSQEEDNIFRNRSPIRIATSIVICMSSSSEDDATEDTTVQHVSNQRTKDKSCEGQNKNVLKNKQFQVESDILPHSEKLVINGNAEKCPNINNTITHSDIATDVEGREVQSTRQPVAQEKRKKKKKSRSKKKPKTTDVHTETVLEKSLMEGTDDVFNQSSTSSQLQTADVYMLEKSSNIEHELAIENMVSNLSNTEHELAKENVAPNENTPNVVPKENTPNTKFVLAVQDIVHELPNNVHEQIKRVVSNQSNTKHELAKENIVPNSLNKKRDLAVLDIDLKLPNIVHELASEDMVENNSNPEQGTAEKHIGKLSRKARKRLFKKMALTKSLEDSIAKGSDLSIAKKNSSKETSKSKKELASKDTSKILLENARELNQLMSGSLFLGLNRILEHLKFLELLLNPSIRRFNSESSECMLLGIYVCDIRLDFTYGEVESMLLFNVYSKHKPTSILVTDDVLYNDVIWKDLSGILYYVDSSKCYQIISYQ